MNESSCEILLDYYPRVSEVAYLFSTYIANCVFNSFLSYTAIMLNIVTIHVIRKTSSLPKTLKTLLLSLAVSDVGVGFLVQPFYTSILINWLQQSSPGYNTRKAFYFIGNLFSTASFFGVVAVSVDRFSAIHLHLRYQELVTYKRVDTFVISIWVISISASFSIFWVSRNTVFSFVVVIIGIVGVFLTTMIYISIYLTVRRHKSQIQVLQVQPQAQTGEISNFTSIINSIVGIFYVYLTFLICYLRCIISLAAFKTNGPNVTLKKFFLFSVTLLYLNSSLNPVIYCWKMIHVRRAVMNILRNMSWHRSGASLETPASAASHNLT